MNYQRHYDILCQRSPQHKPNVGYYEKHRILPGCMGGKYIIGNVVWLHPEEHYVAHQLLVKIHPYNTNLIFAVQLMTLHSTQNRTSNKLYGWIKRKLSVVSSRRSKLVWQQNREKMLAGLEKGRTPASRQKKSIAVKMMWKNDDGTRKSQIIQLQRDTNAVTAQRNRDLWNTTEYRERMSKRRHGSNSATMKALWSDPIRKQQMLDARRASRRTKNETHKD